MRDIGIFILLLCLISLPAQAQIRENSKAPVEISADEALEWQREDQLYIARGNAMVKQEDLRLQGDIIVAHYREKDGSTDIWKIEAENNVTLSSDGRTANGDRLVYNLETGLATLTGHNLKIVTPQETISAQDKITYSDADQTMTAYGNAHATRGTDTLSADRLTAHLTESTDGARDISRIDAEGNVVITTPQDVVTGTRGSYDTKTQKARLYGGVTIRRGQDELMGEWAEVDLTTGVSQLFAPDSADGQPGRVRGIFYPKSKEDGS